jgi:hypothetical protein
MDRLLRGLTALKVLALASPLENPMIELSIIICKI